MPPPICPRCAAEVPPSARFCMSCGLALERRCPACAVAVPAEARFCMACGAALDAAAAAAPAPAPAPPRAPDGGGAPTAPAAEHRQITVMFTDLVGSTALSEQIDPEALREILRTYQELAGRIVQRFGGHLAKYLGDGLLVYFGYPTAHEDDGQRAVRAGLALLEALEPLRERVRAAHGAELKMRVGVHTGPVVAGDMDSEGALESMAVVGRTPNVAARLQERAAPDTLVVSEATRRLIAGYFEIVDLGEHEMRGLGEPMSLYRVVRESAARSRLEARARGRLAPMVGREHEFGMLAGRWGHALDGQGSAILLVGDAGIGKSRLVRALVEHVAADPSAWLTECGCAPHAESTALFPIVALLNDVVLAFERGEDGASRLDKIEGFVAQYGMPADEAVPLLADLLGVPLAGRHPPLALTPEKRKQRTLALLADLLLRRAAAQPVLFVLEDLHWADPTTRELLDLLVDRCGGARLFVLVTSRPEPAAPAPWRPDVALVALGRLSAAQAGRMVADAAAGARLPEEVSARIAERTDGVPLFVEEMTRMLIESGLLERAGDRWALRGELPDRAIPSTLQDLLTARLDRLAEAKPVAQFGATVGREFGHDLLAAAAPFDPPRLAPALDRLVASELVYRKGRGPQATYRFKHALIQDVAYGSLLTPARRANHARIVRAYEAAFPGIVAAQPALLAHHCSEAGLTEEAIAYWKRAGHAALAASANRDAIAHFQRGLALLGASGEPGPAHDAEELSFQLPLSSAILFARGYAAPEIAGVLERALALCEALDDPVGQFHVLWGIHAWRVVRAEYDVAFDYGNRLMALAAARPEPSYLREAHHNLVTPAFYRGHFALAVHHGAEGVAAPDAERSAWHAGLTGQNREVTNRVYLAIALAHLGRRAEALAHGAAALDLARGLDDAFTLGYAAHHLGWLYHACGLGPEAEEAGILAIEVAREHAFGLWEATGTVYRGAGRLLQGRFAEAAEDIRRGRDLYMGIGARLAVSYYHGLLAEALWRLGGRDEALALLEEAMTHVETYDERFYEAELHRLRAEILAEGPVADRSAALAALERALAVAEAQEARPWVLRAATSRARLVGDAAAQAALAAALSALAGERDLPDVVAARSMRMDGRPARAGSTATKDGKST